MIIKISDLNEEVLLEKLTEIGNILDQYERQDLANIIDELIERFSNEDKEISVEIPDEETEDIDFALQSLRESLK